MSKSRMDDGSHQSSGLLSPDETACPWKEGGWMPGDQPAGVLSLLISGAISSRKQFSTHTRTSCCDYERSE